MIWLGIAAAAVAAFCVFSGQYTSEYEYEDDAEVVYM